MTVKKVRAPDKMPCVYTVRIHLMATFTFEQQQLTIYAFGQTIPMLLVGPAKVEYFRGNDVAKFLGYKQPAIAVTKHVRERHVKTLRELVLEGIYGSYTPATVDQNELNSRWFTEPGLYRLIFKSQMPFATDFEDWVTEKVLPSIRKTGSYSLQQSTPTATQDSDWCSKRVEGKELMKLKNASLQQLIAGGFGQTGPKLYAIAANLINQAVLGFQETTKQFKKQQQLPGHISIPDMLNMQGQVARCYAETCFQKFITDNLQRLRDLAEPELLTEFKDLKLNLRQGFVSTGMGDLQSKLLTVNDAKKRKVEQAYQARKQQKLLQAKQPKAIQCSA